VRGAILIGILATAALGIPLGVVQYQGILSAPPSLAPTLFQLDILGALQTGLVTVIFVFFFLDLFDTIGTLIGEIEFMGRLPISIPELFPAGHGVRPAGSRPEE